MKGPLIGRPLPWTPEHSPDGDLMRGYRGHIPRLCPIEGEEAGVLVQQFLSHLSIESSSWDIDFLVLLTRPEPTLSTLPGPERGYMGP